ncbi:MAG: molybdopterin molybdotransferase MoeA [Alphaproteobacteria bacterium]|nr:molybdopterin molybdotransferase MoeA [Alphaproteobacteria bacterium]
MLEIQDAVTRILACVSTVEAESVAISGAFRRVAAESVSSAVDVPPWDNSAMDGFAVRAAEASAGARISIVGEGAAGRPLEGALPVGNAAAIMTGAPVPEGADAVVMVENTDGGRDGSVTIEVAPAPGANIRRRGADIAVGDVLVRAGQRITPGVAGLLASAGVAEVKVRKRLRIALLATGDELVEPGGTLGPGQIYSSNPVALAGLIEEAGGEPVLLGAAPDDLDGLVERMRVGLDADALLTTGGVSVGRYDLVKDAFEVLGIGMDFWKVRMKPGKPLAFGVARHGGRDVPVFGLPGNPVSCMVNFLEFVRPWMLASMGVEQPFLPMVEAVALTPIHETPGRAKLLRVTLEETPLGWGCRSTGSQSSGVLTSMARAHGLLFRSPEQGPVALGERVRVQLFDPSFLDRADPGL